MFKPNVPVAGLQGRSFQEWVVRQPVKEGGLGLRSIADTAALAFIGAVGLAIPSFITAGICPQLAEQVGGEECFGTIDTAASCDRWRVLVNSGCRAGAEFHEAWGLVSSEAKATRQWLEEPEEEAGHPLLVSETEVGEGVDVREGETLRGILQRRVEQLRARALVQALSVHPDQTARPVGSWPQRDKLSSAWALTLPGPGTRMANDEFAEVCASHLCLHSPAAKGVLGQSVGKSTVDPFGDRIRAEQLPGDGFRHRHDAVKRQIARLARWARVEARVEVFGEFSHLIPQEGLNRMERGRKRQGLVPDFLLRFNHGDCVNSVLAELKVLSCCPTRYPVGGPKGGDKAVDRRANQLQGEYLNKAKEVDRVHVGVPEGQVGPVETKLAGFGKLRGLVFGAWGEASAGVHSLVEELAEQRSKSGGMIGAGGCRSKAACAKGSKGVATGQIRRMLSVVAVRAQARLLLDRLCSVGSGAVEAARRRKRDVWEQAQMDKRHRRELAAARGQDFGGRPGSFNPSY